jgi:hypothetical protein
MTAIAFVSLLWSPSPPQRMPVDDRDPKHQPARGKGASRPCRRIFFRAVPAFELAILRAIFHSKGPKAFFTTDSSLGESFAVPPLT